MAEPPLPSPSLTTKDFYYDNVGNHLKVNQIQRRCFTCSWCRLCATRHHQLHITDLAKLTILTTGYRLCQRWIRVLDDKRRRFDCGGASPFRMRWIGPPPASLCEVERATVRHGRRRVEFQTNWVKITGRSKHLLGKFSLIWLAAQLSSKFIPLRPELTGKVKENKKEEMAEPPPLSLTTVISKDVDGARADYSITPSLSSVTGDFQVALDNNTSTNDTSTPILSEAISGSTKSNVAVTFMMGHMEEQLLLTAVAEKMAIACARTVVADDKEMFLGELNLS
ncbi:hypothetical protein Ddye_017874 [Dipteronia dyeriana]|uniref:Uncharacterized protein n=1 Tax=Dipteronia dyeriana TaxID=168575 RepID=A0AAD9X1S5_9ROSI|nr:hypothetical protein Ddye_017874 [Dipteronia dyeriana]